MAIPFGAGVASTYQTEECIAEELRVLVCFCGARRACARPQSYRDPDVVRSRVPKTEHLSALGIEVVVDEGGPVRWVPINPAHKKGVRASPIGARSAHVGFSTVLIPEMIVASTGLPGSSSVNFEVGERVIPDNNRPDQVCPVLLGGGERRSSIFFLNIPRTIPLIPECMGKTP